MDLFVDNLYQSKSSFKKILKQFKAITIWVNHFGFRQKFDEKHEIFQIRIFFKI